MKALSFKLSEPLRVKNFSRLPYVKIIQIIIENNGVIQFFFPFYSSQFQLLINFCLLYLSFSLAHLGFKSSLFLPEIIQLHLDSFCLPICICLRLSDLVVVGKQR